MKIRIRKTWILKTTLSAICFLSQLLIVNYSLYLIRWVERDFSYRGISPGNIFSRIFLDGDYFVAALFILTSLGGIVFFVKRKSNLGFFISFISSFIYGLFSILIFIIHVVNYNLFGLSR